MADVQGFAAWRESQQAAQPTTSPTVAGFAEWRQTRTQPAAPTFEGLTSDETLLRHLRNYYSFIDEKSGREVSEYTPEDLVNRYISDRRWVDQNTADTAGEAHIASTMAAAINGEELDPSNVYVQMLNATDPAERARFAEILDSIKYQRDVWEQLPNVFEEGGQGPVGLVANVLRGMTDPIGVATAVMTGGLGRVAQVGVGAVTEGAIGAIGEHQYQEANIATGRQEELDWSNIGMAAALSAASSAAAVGATNVATGAARTIMSGGSSPAGPTTQGARQGLGNNQAFDSDFRGLGDRTISSVFDQAGLAATISDATWGRHSTPYRLKLAQKRAQTGDFDPAYSAYWRFRVLPAAPKRIDHLLNRGGLRAWDNRRTPTITRTGKRVDSPTIQEDTSVKGFNQIMDMFESPNAAMDFLIGVAARRIRNEQARGLNIKSPWNDPKFWMEQGFSQQQAEAKAKRALDDMINEFNVVGIYQKADIELKNWWANVLDYMRKAELMTDDSYVNLLKKLGNDGYVPLYQEFIDPVTGAVTGTSSRPNPSAKVTSAKGTQLRYMPFHKAIYQYVTAAVTASDMNRAWKQLIQEAEDFQSRGSNPLLVEEITGKDKIGTATIFTNSAIAALRKQGLIVADPAQAFGGKTPVDPLIQLYGFTKSIQETADGDRIIMYYDDGTPRFYKVKNAALADMVDSYGADAVIRIENLARSYSRFKGNLITSDPRYMMRAFARDQLSAAINSDHAFIPFFSPIASIYSLARDNARYKEFLLNGGSLSSFNATAKNNVGIADYASANQNAGSKYVNRTMEWLNDTYLGKGWKGLNKLTEGVEMITRFSEYRLARRTMTAAGAAIAGREVSIDFAKRGTNRAINRYRNVTVFFGAGMNALHKTAQRIKDRPVKTLGTVAMGLIPLELFLYATGSEFPEYDQLHETVKDTFWTIPNFADWSDIEGMARWAAGGEAPPLNPEVPFLLFAKPLDFAVFSSSARRFAEQMERGGDFAAIAAQWITGDLPESLLNAAPSLALPSFVDPLVDIANNTNWAGDPIIPPQMNTDTFPSEHKIRSDTSQFAIQLSNWLNQLGLGDAGGYNNPITVDYLMEQYFGGVGNYIWGALDFAVRNEEDFGVAPTPRADQLDLQFDGDWMDIVNAAESIVRSTFLVADPIRNSQHVSNIYDLYNQFESINQDINAQLKTEGLADNAMEEMREPETRGLLFLRERFRSQIEGLFELQTMMRTITTQQDTTAADRAGLSMADWKRREIDRMQSHINIRAEAIWSEIEEIARNNADVRAALFSYKIGGINFGDLIE